jgi:hypothetical protein
LQVATIVIIATMENKKKQTKQKKDLADFKQVGRQRPSNKLIQLIQTNSKEKKTLVTADGLL